MKPIKKWKFERQQQIYRRVTFVLFVIALLCGAFALGCTITFNQIYGADLYAGVTEELYKARYGLYAGLTAEDWLSYNVDIEPEETEELTEALYIEDDLETLAKIVYAEAGAQGRKCMLYVGSVILNRLNNGYSWQTGETILEVWSRRGQYTTYRYRDNIEPSAEAYEVAEYLLINGSVLPEYVLYQHGNGRAVLGTVEYAEINGEVFSY